MAKECGLWRKIDIGSSLIPAVTNSGTLGYFLSFSFFICDMGIVIVSTAQNYCECSTVSISIYLPI